MISGFIERAMLKAQARLGFGGDVVVWLVAAVVFGLIAVVFLTIALYAWLAELYGGPVSALIVGAAYAVLAGAAASFAVLAQRSNRQRARLQVARAVAAQGSAWPLDPKLMAVGLELGKSMGWRRLAPLAVAGLGLLAAIATGRSLQPGSSQTPKQRDD